MAFDSMLVRPGFLDYEDDDDLDETLLERLWGLMEMFPEPVQKVLENTVSKPSTALKVGFNKSCTALWIVVSSATLTALPALLMGEMALHQEQALQQQKQILLGPNAAMSGSGGGHLPLSMMPPGMASGR